MPLLKRKKATKKTTKRATKKTTKRATKKAVRRAEIGIGDIKYLLLRIGQTSTTLERSARELRYEAEKIQRRPGIVGAAALNIEQTVSGVETVARVFSRSLKKELKKIEAKRSSR